MRSYAERKAARIERLRARAERLARESEAAHARASQMADAIPFGQPILVGHHSEGRDRRYRERIRNAFDRSLEASREAAEFGRRADAAQRNDAISSDDPEAVARLREKLTALEAEQARDREINATIRTAKRHATKAGTAWEPIARVAMTEMGLSEQLAFVLTQPDFAGRIGIADYVLSNRNANMRRIRERIEQLEHRATAPAKEPITIGGVRIEENDNRVQVFFPSKPDASVRSELKSNGFRWAPSEGAWQRMASDHAWCVAKQIANRGAT